MSVTTIQKEFTSTRTVEVQSLPLSDGLFAIRFKCDPVDPEGALPGDRFFFEGVVDKQRLHDVARGNFRELQTWRPALMPENQHINYWLISPRGRHQIGRNSGIFGVEAIYKGLEQRGDLVDHVAHLIDETKLSFFDHLATGSWQEDDIVLSCSPDGCLRRLDGSLLPLNMRLVVSDIYDDEAAEANDVVERCAEFAETRPDLTKMSDEEYTWTPTDETWVEYASLKNYGEVRKALSKRLVQAFEEFRASVQTPR